MSPDLRGQLQRTLGTAYTLERELGGGGMSRVFVAEETALARKVVVKVLPPDLAAGVSVERFNREILVAAKLQHAHIVPVLSAGETDGLPYYTMPFVDGESLRARLSRTNGMPITEAIGVLRDVSKALAFAHERGVVHRDIKPDNVLLAGGSAVVTDFGIAKALAAAQRGGHLEGDSPKDPSESALTLLGTSIGTPVYMAPEQAAADPLLDHRADIYSFGCMAYELLAGQPPFLGRTPQKLLAAHMGESPAPVGELRLDCPRMLADLVMRCLAKSADERPQSAGEIIRVLETVTSGGAQPAMPAILLGGRGMLGKALAVYAVAFVLVAVLAKSAITVIGLPDWVFPGALIVMALGLPVILLTGYVHYTARGVLTATPTFTPGGRPSLVQGTMATIAVKASPHLSWRRAGLGGVYAVGGFVLLVGAFMALRAMGIGPAGSLLAAGALTSTDAIVVADFNVKGGADSSLGRVLSDAVRTDLAQSKVLTVASTSAIAGGLQRMQKPASSRLTLQLARELAQREGMKAVVECELTPLGAGFIVTTRLVNATTGDELASFRGTAASPTELLPTVDKLTRQLRGKAGESLKAVRASPSLAQVTTSSLEALRKYSEGSRAIDYENDFVHGIPLLKEAVAADSTFAMAWRKLSAAYNFAVLPGGDAAATNAYRFRDRLPEQERMATVAHYFFGPGRDRAKAIEAYESMARTGNNVGFQNLGTLYASRREFTRAESVYKGVISRGGAARVTFTNLASALYAQGRIAEAESVASQADSLFPSAAALSLHHRFLLNRAQLDSAQRLYTAARTRSDPTVRFTADLNILQLQLMRGQLAAAKRTNELMIEDNRARGVAPDQFDAALRGAFIDAWYREQQARALHTLDSALAKQQERTSYLLRLTELYANAGRPDRARQFLAEYLKAPRDSSQVRQQEPQMHNVRAQVLLAEGHALEAAGEFRAGDKAPDGPVSECAICLYANLAQAFDRAKAADSAVTYYERYVTTPMLNRGFQDPQYLAGTLKRLGELYEAKGDRQKAASAYTRFVELWKDADPELQPKVAEVRRRLQLLSRAEPAR